MRERKSKANIIMLTGLADSNGDCIYVGDIVKIHKPYNTCPCDKNPILRTDSLEIIENIYGDIDNRPNVLDGVL